MSPNTCDHLSANMCIHVCVSMYASAVWGFRGMDYFAPGLIQRSQSSVRWRGERGHCCGPDECHRCLRK